MTSTHPSTTNMSPIDDWETFATQVSEIEENSLEENFLEENSLEEHHSEEYACDKRALSLTRRDYLTSRFPDEDLVPISADLPPEMLFLIATHICYEDKVDTAETLIRFMECIQSVIPPRIIIAELQRIKSPAYKVIHDFLMYMKHIDRLFQDIPECFGTVCCIEPVQSRWETTTYRDSCRCGKRRCYCEFYDHTSAPCACGITELSIDDFGRWFMETQEPTIIIPHLFTDVKPIIEDIIPEPQVGMYVHSLLVDEDAEEYDY